MSKDNKDQRPLSRKKRGYLLAVIGGTLGGPIGWITSPLVLYLLNRTLKEKDGKQPNIFKTWALIGIIGAPLSILPFSFFPEEGKEVEPKVEIDPAELKIDKHISVSTYREDDPNRLIAMMDLKTGDLLG